MFGSERLILSCYCILLIKFSNFFLVPCPGVLIPAPPPLFLFLFCRFVPSVNVIIYHGDKKERDDIRRKHMPKTIGPKFPILVTSYEVAMMDARKHLKCYDWKYLVVDEVYLVEALKFNTHYCWLIWLLTIL